MTNKYTTKTEKAKDKISPIKVFQNYFANELQTNKTQETIKFNEEEITNVTNLTKRIHNFFKVPYNFEISILYGILLVLDIFFHYVVIYPLKNLVSVYQKYFKKNKISEQKMVDLIVFCICLFILFVVSRINFYTLLEGIHESHMKLMFLYNALELLDGVFTPFSLQTIDSLSLAIYEHNVQTGEKKFFDKKVIIEIIITTFVLLTHTCILFTSVVMVGISLTSKKLSMISFLLRNNWIEFKQTIMKRHTQRSMRNIFREDCFERVKLYLFTYSVIAEDIGSPEFNINNDQRSTLKWLVLAEFIVDWSKNAFVVKNNDISPKVFKSFRSKLAQIAWVSHNQDTENAYTDTIQKEMGFAMIPFIILFFKVTIVAIWNNYSFFLFCFYLSAFFLLLSLIAIIIKFVHLFFMKRYAILYRSEKKTTQKKDK
ncbi:hypothetical protein M0813_06226 [Anaeramoeba flamelloides]|uniref:Uncharacterized protein n=1 Tax=Anaeramoeba flamelloides TaxID=1746091 RepID=A0ABQ8XEX7_9EUKA|nr:hypothetical protein M0813_06226 [Anaeramoeba flamelloides]